MTDTFNTAPLLALYPTPAAFSRSIKVFFNGEIRRFSFVGSSFNELIDEMVQMGVPARNASICYQDDEGDWVTICTDVELITAFELFGNKPIRLDVRPRGTPAIAPSVSSPSVPRSPAPVTMSAPAPVAFQNKHQLKTFVKKAKFDEKMAKKEAKLEEKLAKKEMRKEFKSYLREQVKEPRFVGRFVKHVTVEDNYEFLPGTPFVKTWRFRNEGQKPWPVNCILLFVGRKGDLMGAPNFVTLERSVNPGEEIDVSVPMTSPANAGTYFGYWRLAEPSGKKFGQRVRILIKVVDSSSSSSEEREKETPEVSNWESMLIQLESMGFKEKGLNVKLLVKTRGDMDRVVNKLIRREEKKSGVKRGNH